MRKKFLALLIMAALMIAPMALAQDQQLASVLTFHTKLEHAQHYEGLLKDIFAAFKKAGLQSPIQASTSMSDPGAYTFIVPFTSWTEFGDNNVKIGQAYASIPDVMQEVQGTFTHSEQSIWAVRPDLSYAPSTPRIAPGEGGFTRVTFFYPHPGQGAAFEALITEAIAVNEKHGNPNGFNVAQLAVGAESPAYVVIVAGKNEADFFGENAKWQEKTESEMQAIVQKAGPMLRRIEYGSSIPRPDLSYTP